MAQITFPSGGSTRIHTENPSANPEENLLGVVPFWGSSGSTNNFPTGNIRNSLPCWETINLRAGVGQPSGSAGLPPSANFTNYSVTAPASAGGTTTTVIPASASNVAILLSVVLQASAAVTVQFRDVTNTADLSPAFSLTAGQVIVLSSIWGLARSNVGGDVSVVVTGSSGNVLMMAVGINV
jgi:hypothetical protein